MVPDGHGATWLGFGDEKSFDSALREARGQAESPSGREVPKSTGVYTQSEFERKSSTGSQIALGCKYPEK